MGQQKVMTFNIKEDSILRYQDRLYVPNIGGLKKRILTEAHEPRYIIYLGLTEMYHDLKEIYKWNNRKRDIENFVAKCIVCQQVKVQQLRLGGISIEIELTMSKCEMININFMVGLPWFCNEYD